LSRPFLVLAQPQDGSERRISSEIAAGMVDPDLD
jgi:hypothetical protein